MSAERLQKIIAAAGFGSRRESETMIAMGEITINGRIAKLGDKADLAKDHIKIRGKLLQSKGPERVVVAIYKPRGILSQKPAEATNDQGTVFDLMVRIKERVFPVGRLDSDTEGLLLLTNDGELAQRLNKAKYEVPKTYTVKIDGHLDSLKIKRLEHGLKIEGERLKAFTVESIKRSDGKEWLKVSTTDPRNRVVRHAMEGVGRPVDKVRRESFAGISLKGMARAQYRYLSPEEVRKLREWVGLS